jgi:hypothetical protein
VRHRNGLLAPFRCLEGRPQGPVELYKTVSKTVYLQEDGQMDDLEALRRLSHDRRLEELDAYVAPLALVVALGVAHDEVAHSRLLAFLLDPR